MFLLGLLPTLRLFKACCLIVKFGLMLPPGFPRSVVSSHLISRNKLGFAIN